MFTHVYYLKLVLYGFCFFFFLACVCGKGEGRHRNFHVSLSKGDHSKQDFHNTQHEGTLFCYFLWLSLSSSWWCIWSGFLWCVWLCVLCTFINQMKAWGPMDLLCAITFSRNRVFPPFYINTNNYLTDLLIKIQGLVTKELNRADTSHVL